MQGLESLNQFKNFMSSLGGLGRYGDTYMIHAEEGETVVPMEVLDRNPLLKKRLFKSMKALGIDPGRYIVGNDLNSLNPVTGQPEFFFKRIKKALGDISGYAAPIVGAMYGPAAGAMVGAGLGAFKREQPGDPSQWQQMAMRGGITGLGTNIATGQGFTPFGGVRGAYGVESWNPMRIGEAMMEDPSGLFKTGEAGDTDRKWEFMEKYFPEETKKTVSEQVLSKAKELAAANNEPENWKKYENLAQLDVSKKTGIPMGKIIGWGLALGALDKFTSEDQDVGDRYEYELTGEIYDPILNPQLKFSAEGGIMDLQGGGYSQGPGTGTSDSIPAMLSDGEFVMTADAVRGAGGGDRREGARKMYEAMDRLEARV